MFNLLTIGIFKVAGECTQIKRRVNLSASDAPIFSFGPADSKLLNEASTGHAIKTSHR